MQGGRGGEGKGQEKRGSERRGEERREGRGREERGRKGGREEGREGREVNLSPPLIEVSPYITHCAWPHFHSRFHIVGCVWHKRTRMGCGSWPIRRYHLSHTAPMCDLIGRSCTTDCHMTVM